MELYRAAELTWIPWVTSTLTQACVGTGEGRALGENLAAVPDALHFDPQHRAEGTAVLRDPDGTGSSH